MLNVGNVIDNSVVQRLPKKQASRSSVEKMLVLQHLAIRRMNKRIVWLQLLTIFTMSTRAMAMEKMAIMFRAIELSVVAWAIVLLVVGAVWAVVAE